MNIGYVPHLEGSWLLQNGSAQPCKQKQRPRTHSPRPAQPCGHTRSPRRLVLSSNAVEPRPEYTPTHQM